MTYNPSILDLRYLKLIPQNALMTFRNYVYYLGPNATSNIWATTTNGWVLWYDFLTTTIVWDLLQTYASIKTPSINPIGGTLTIGNEAVDTNVEIATQTGRSVILHLGDGNSSTGGIHIGNGTTTTGNVNILNGTGATGTINLGNQVLSPATVTTLHLNNSLTPTYPYPVGTSTGNNTPSIGTAGTIGYIPPTTFITFIPGDGIAGGAGNSMRSTNLTPGIWMLYGFARKATGQYIYASGIGFSTVLNSNVGEVGRRATIQQGGTPLEGCWALTTTAIVNPTTNTTYYLNVRDVSNTTVPISYHNLIAVRIG
jgi:hypothetical protein